MMDSVRHFILDECDKMLDKWVRTPEERMMLCCYAYLLPYLASSSYPPTLLLTSTSSAQRYASCMCNSA